MRGTPFVDYVKKGAIEEIQNYKSLVSVDKVFGQAGLVGYKTTWNVQGIGQTTGTTSVSTPITYFDAKGVNSDTVEVIESDSSYAIIYDQMLTTFKFTR